MSLQIYKRFFENRGEVLEDLKASGFWPRTFVSGPSPGLEVHWHSEEVHAYVVEAKLPSWMANPANATQ